MTISNRMSAILAYTLLNKETGQQFLNEKRGNKNDE